MDRAVQDYSGNGDATNLYYCTTSISYNVYIYKVNGMMNAFANNQIMAMPVLVN